MAIDAIGGTAAAERDLGNGYHWVGSTTIDYDLRCNPYLLVDGDDAVLFDPGSLLDIHEVMDNVRAIVPLEKVRHVVLHHQDPDFVSGVPALLAAGMKFELVTHWRTWTLIRYYGIETPLYLVDEHDHLLTLGSGRLLRFIPTPYLHFPGSIATWDKAAKFLLSSDLFGAITPRWSLFADLDYMEGMKAFHEHYMPGNDILRPVMDQFLGLPIQAILPQHGSIIRGDVRPYILALRDLECGTMMRPTRKDLEKAGGWRVPLEEMLGRVAAMYGMDFLAEFARALEVDIDPQDRTVRGYSGSGEQIWLALPATLKSLRGPSALNLVEPLARRLSREYGLPMPPALDRVVAASENRVDVAASVSHSSDALARDPVTGMYNEKVFRSFLNDRVQAVMSTPAAECADDDCLAVFGIDEGLGTIELHHGPNEVESVLKGIARIFNEVRHSEHPVFRLYGATFALWLPCTGFDAALAECDSVRKRVQESKTFIEQLTVSAGLVTLSELRPSVGTDAQGLVGSLNEVAIRRLRLAKKRGGNMICTSTELGSEDLSKARILVADDDAVNAEVLKNFLESQDYSVMVAQDGAEALELISQEGFDIVIAELQIPKYDAFAVKESMSLRSGTKDIPFILLSHLKNERSVTRAAGLGIMHYLRKPFIMAELMGVVANLAASGSRK